MFDFKYNMFDASNIGDGLCFISFLDVVVAFTDLFNRTNQFVRII